MLKITPERINSDEWSVEPCYGALHAFIGAWHQNVRYSSTDVFMTGVSDVDMSSDTVKILTSEFFGKPKILMRPNSEFEYCAIFSQARCSLGLRAVRGALVT